ncbi:response regulator transcription factor [Streptomyces zagrosensis]|uniref:DNA-binding response OmpR family regulator n=1 Tax=Streptomyces zagrosensis TaxID=1042984 RepID=A0A7W9QEM8_9ACTN|nr:response regulator transcription factor [Streptomyces zagrosensis]MBB5938736.1 DNA-binding response OmpR family regulator [Streptomyces zagrosensis]
MRILLIEDDPDLSELLGLGLRNESYAVDLATTYAYAEELLRVTAYDLACFDLGLPDGDGLELIRRVAREPQLHRPRRSLVLTARDAVASRVAGLDAGADDYLVKPFHFEELVARVRALLRRGDSDDGHGSTLILGELTLDLATRRAWRAGVELRLTDREFSLLRYFMHHPGEVLSAENLLEHVWDAHANPFTASVRVILSRLRRKLGEPALIVTLTKVGYQLKVHP